MVNKLSNGAKNKEVSLVQLLSASVIGGGLVFLGYYFLNNRNYVVNKDGTLGSLVKLALNTKG